MGALVPTKRIITIEISESNGIEVIENGMTTGQLAWDEMLGHVAAMTIPIRIARPNGIFTMHTPEVLAQRRKEAEERYLRGFKVNEVPF